MVFGPLFHFPEEVIFLRENLFKVVGKGFFMNVHERYFARKDLISKIHGDLMAVSNEYEKLIPRDGRVEVLDTDIEKKLILANGALLIFETEEGYFPTVRGALLLDNNKRFVTVDKGAVKYITNGADVMRPGVVAYDPKLRDGDYVVVTEETYGKPLAIGKTLWSGNKYASKKEGKCVKNIHYVGDELWGLG
jgi:PUA domain protein